MSPKALRRLIGHALIVAAAIGVVILGNVRLQASEAARVGPRSAPPRVPVAWVANPDRPAVGVDARPAAMIATDGVADETDDVELVPAIYARNPDVRFVYSRQVRKWM